MNSPGKEEPTSTEVAETKRAGCPALSSRYLWCCYFFIRFLP